MKTLMVCGMLLSPLFAKEPVLPKAADHVTKVEVDLGNPPVADKAFLDKIVFDARVASLSQILGRKSDQMASPTFLVIPAEATENLGAGLLWCDVEVELSDGRTLKFQRFRFHLLSKGIEGDVRRLDGSDTMLEFKLPGEGKPEQPKKAVMVKRLRVSNPQFK